VPPPVDDNGVRRPGCDSLCARRPVLLQDRVEPVTPRDFAAAHHDHHEPAALPRNTPTRR
jgi:hypothetical protein